MTAPEPTQDSDPQADATSTWSAWPSWLLAAAGGLALYLSHPDAEIRVLAFVVPALFASAASRQHAGRRSALPAAAAFGMVAYGLMFRWLIPSAGYAAWVFLVVVHVLWLWGLGWLLARLRRWPAFPLTGALAWVGIDAWRATVPLGGFAWGTLGTSQVGVDWMVPMGRIAGENAMTLFVVLISLGLLLAVEGPLAATRDAAGRIRLERVRSTLGAGQVGVAWLAGGALVVTLATVEPPAEDGVAQVAIVQPWDEEFWQGSDLALDEVVASNALDLTRQAVAEGPLDLVVWPESTIDADPSRSAVLATVVEQAGMLTDGHLLAGMNRNGPRPRTFLNTSAVVDATGDIVGSYQKRHLVPFGEYVPARSLIGWFPGLEQTPNDGVPGADRQVVEVGGLRVAVAICFESLFGPLVRENVLAGDEPAQLLVVSTNDVSFKRVDQPAQHRDQSRLRAIETGRWVVHASVAGGSTVIDPSGGVHEVSDLFEAEYRRVEIPLVTGSTPFLRTGDWLRPLTMLLSAVAALALALMSRRTPPQDLS